MYPLFEAIAKFGLAPALVVFFFWQTWKREQAMSKRITKVEDEFREALSEQLKKSILVNQQCSGCIEDNTEALNKNTDVIETLKVSILQANGG